jgi:thioredoxin-related protein
MPMSSPRAIAPWMTLLALLATATASGAQGWVTDWEAAKKQAAKENKDLLLDFTGSDWCGWCIRLHNEVFSQPAFKNEAPKKFVLVELDFPRSTRLDPKTKAQNEKLQVEFGVEGFPTIFLADSQGRVYARTGYQPGGAASYLQHLDTLREDKAARDRDFAAAAKAESDSEKARLLDKALTQLERRQVLVGYDEEMREIVKLDKENKAGLKAKYDERLQLAEIERKTRLGEHDAAIELADRYVRSELAGAEAKQKACFLKARVLFVKKDYRGTIASLEAAQKHEPSSQLARQIPGIIANVKRQIRDGDSETGGN